MLRWFFHQDLALSWHSFPSELFIMHVCGEKDQFNKISTFNEHLLGDYGMLVYRPVLSKKVTTMFLKLQLSSHYVII